MASGTEKRQRNKRSTPRFTDEEFNRIAAKADNAGIGFAAYLRASALDGDAGPRAQRRPPANHKVLRQLLGEIGRIGNNVNQIARSINSGDAADFPEVREAIRAINEIRNAILDALGKSHGPNNGPIP